MDGREKLGWGFLLLEFFGGSGGEMGWDGPRGVDEWNGFFDG